MDPTRNVARVLAAACARVRSCGKRDGVSAMSDSAVPSSSENEPLDVIVATYLQQVEAGEAPDRNGLLLRHPEHVERLRAFFADVDRLDRQAADLRLSSDPNRTTDASETPGLLPRIRYFGDYELLEVIARGGMGVVYKARQVSLNRIVALKMILPADSPTPRDVPPLPCRGRGGRQPRPSAHRADLRGRRARRPAVLTPCASSRARRWPATRAATAAARPGSWLPSAGRCTTLARTRHPAPRPQAVQHPASTAGTAARHRLRPGQAARRGTVPRAT